VVIAVESESQQRQCSNRTVTPAAKRQSVTIPQSTTSSMGGRHARRTGALAGHQPGRSASVHHQTARASCVRGVRLYITISH